MRSKNKKYWLLGILFLLLLSLSLGLAYLTKQLQINGTTSIDKNSWVIYFDKATEIEGSVEATKELTIDDTKTIVDFGMTLDKPGDYYEFDVNVVNDGTVDAMIDTVIQVGLEKNEEKYISYTATYSDGTPIKYCDLLAAGTKEKVKVRVEFKEVDNKEDLPPNDLDLTLELRLNYIQADSCAIAPVIKRKVFINPNGGEYKGTTEITTIQGDPEDEITLETPTRYAANFMGWELEDGARLEGNKIIIGNEDISIKAIWEISNEAVARIKENYYLSLQEAFNAAETNDTIYLLKEISENPTNTKQVTLDLGTYKVNGTLTNRGDIKIINGIMEASSGAAVVNEGTVTLGNNDGEVKTDGVALIGNEIGIDQQGTFNFYDGYIEGKVGIKGEYNKIPENYFVFVDRNATKDCQKIYLTETPTRAVAKTIEGGEVYYFNLQDAINTSVVTGFNLYAVRNFEAAYTLTIKENERTLFDIKGYEVDFGNDVTNNGELTIKNSEEEGSLNVSRPINNNGTLNIERVKINQTTPANIIENHGALNIEASTLTALAGYAISNTGGRSLTLDENTYIKANQYAIYNQTDGEFVINGGNIEGISNVRANNSNEEEKLKLDGGVKVTRKSSYAIQNNGILVVENAHINGDTSYGIYNDSKVIVNDGEVKGSQAIYNGTITINNGTITGTSTGISGSNIEINGGTIQSEGTGISGGTATINNGSITADNIAISINNLTVNGGIINGKVLGISVNGSRGMWSTTRRTAIINGGNIKGLDAAIEGNDLGTITIIGGTIKGDKYGIKVGGTLTLGEKNGEINIESPHITGDLYGVYKSATTANIYFYDGILKGQTAGYYGEFTGVEDGTKVFEGTETIDEIEYKTAYLVEEEGYLIVGDKEYNSLSKAIEDADGEAVIVIKDNIVGDVVTIPKDKTITIDLNGHELEFSATITNNGTLIIDDTSEEKLGKISNNTTYVITNNGTLEINNGMIEFPGDKNYGAVNNDMGSVTLNNGTIKGNRGIFSTNGIITINGGEILATSIGIEGNSSYSQYPNVNIHGGKVKVNNSSAEGIKAREFTMTGGEIIVNSTNSTGIGVSVRPGKITIDGGKIQVETQNGEAIGIQAQAYNYAHDTLSMTNGTIIANSETKAGIGAKVYDAQIEGGEIFGSTYGVKTDSWQNGSKTNIIIGKKDETITTENPIITGGEYGIYNNLETAKIYFYDGILKGKTEPYYGTITGIEDGTKIADGIETIEENEYKTNYLIEKEYYLRTDGIEYNSLTKAIENIENTGTIEVTASTIVGDLVNIPEGKTITLDLKNHELQFSATITNEGTLIIDDTSEEKQGKLVNSTTWVINNKNKLEINNGTIEFPGSTNYGAVYNNGASVNLNSGIIKGNKGIFSTNGIITINGGEILATSIGIEGNSSYSQYPNVNIHGGKVRVNNASFEGINAREFTMTGGEVMVSGSRGIVITANATISGGNIEVSNLKSSAEGVRCHTLSMTSGTIAAKSETGTGIGAIILNGEILGGEIFGSSYGLQASTDRNVATTISIGEKDGNVITETPIIAGEQYGLYNGLTTSKIYFYDGVLKGQTAGYYGAINEIEEETRIDETIETIEEADYVVNKLVPINNIMENNNTNTKYKSIQAAIEDSNNGDTLKLIDNVSNYFVIEINEEKEITLDLNGYELYTTKGFVNKGNLRITNTTETASEIKTISTINLIANEGTLNINNISLSNTASTSIITNKNNGNVSLTNVSITAINGIDNQSGFLKLKDTNIETTGTGVGVNSTNKIEIDGGVLKSATYYAVWINAGTESNVIKNTTLDGSFHKNSTDETNIINSTINNSISNNKGTLILQDCSLNSGITNSNGGALIINSGTQTNGTIYNNGTMTINDLVGTSEISNYGSPTFISNNGSLEINNSQMSYTRTASYGGMTVFSNTGTLVSNNNTIILNDLTTATSASFYGLNNSGAGNAVLNNTNIQVGNNSANTTVYGIYSKDTNSTTTIHGGSIEANGTTAYGIYINNGTVTVGEKESSDSPNYGNEFANVSTEYPLIKGIGTTGIGVKKVSGYFNYYDGKLVGSTSAKPDATSEVEYNYEVSTYNEEETGYEYIILEYIKRKDTLS